MIDSKEKVYICYLSNENMNELLSVHRTEEGALRKRKKIMDSLGNSGAVILWVQILERELEE